MHASIYARWAARKLLRPSLVALRHRQLQADDQFLASYPKSGNTWLKSLLVTLIENQAADLDRIETLIPAVGPHQTAEPRLFGRGRLLKTHEAYRPAYQRGIYLVRDGREVAISYFHALQGTANLPRDLSFSDFLKLWLAGYVDGYTPWHHHVGHWLDRIEGDRAWKVVHYRSLVTQTASTLTDIAEFLGIDGVTSARVAWTIEENKKEKLRQREQQSARLCEIRNTTGSSFFRESKANEVSTFFRRENEDLYLRITGDLDNVLVRNLCPNL